MTLSYSDPAEDPAVSLDGSVDVLLAPVKGSDSRRNLDSSLFAKRPGVFTAKFGFALALVGLGWLAVALLPRWWVAVPAIVLIGLMYAHLVELQHECLHEHAYSRRSLNRLAGFVAGLPMLSSYSHYKYDHLRHHAFLGTPTNQEFFNYRFRNLDSPIGFVRASFHLGRYLDVFRLIGLSLAGRLNPAVSKTVAAKRIRTEYIGFGIVLPAVTAVGIVAGSWLPVLCWLLPAVLVAEPAHFLIELPEHYGLNTQTDPNVLTNTRTVQASWFGRWYTNGNDLHTAHHYHQGVPMAQVPRLHELITDRIGTVDPSFPRFYRKVLTGELRFQGDDETCMTR
jgi:fatty acid desaturase